MTTAKSEDTAIRVTQDLRLTISARLQVCTIPHMQMRSELPETTLPEFTHLTIMPMITITAICTAMATEILTTTTGSTIRKTRMMTQQALRTTPLQLP